MVGITCPQCERTIPPDTARADAAFCPFCGWRQVREVMPSVEEESASVDLVETPFEEVSFTLKESLVRFALSALLLTTMMASLVFFIFLLFAICIGVLGGGVPFGQFLARLPRVVSFFGFSWYLCWMS